MNIILERATGLDVHKNMIFVTVLLVQPTRTTKKTTREFKPFCQDLALMTDWLKTFDLQLVVMESNSVYWRTSFETLEQAGIPAWLVNANYVKNVPDRKTDVRDNEWLAELAICGLLKASFIPPQDLRELRMLTRYRRKLSGILSAEKNRLQKKLEDGGIRLSSVVSDIDGVSAHAMIQIIIEKGSIAPNDVIRLAKGKLKAKLNDLALSLDGKISDRHRFVLKQMQTHIESIQTQINEIDAQVVGAMKPYSEEWKLLQTIPGIDHIGAAMLLAEIGSDMTKFGNKDRFCSWARVCPGNNQSAGKKKVEEQVRQTLISKLFSANLPIEHSEVNPSLKADTQRLKLIGGHKRTIVTIAHKLMEIIFLLLLKKRAYCDPEIDYEKLLVERNDPWWIKALDKYGYLNQGSLKIHA